MAMIGKIDVKYTQADLIELVKKDLIAKFGQRDLDGINLTDPMLYTCQALAQDGITYEDKRVQILVHLE